MAIKNKKNKSRRPNGQRKRRTRKGKAEMPPAIPTLFNGHINMVIDPCAAPIGRSVYSGASGLVTRHVSTGALNGGTNVAMILGLVPGGYRTITAATLTGGTALSPTYSVTNVPGYSFLNSTTSQSRVIGACIQIHWNGTEFNRGGSVAYGCIQASGVNAASTTIDNIYRMLPHKRRVVAGDLEIKWNPSAEDESYDVCDAASTVSNFNDRNGLYFAYQGPANGEFGYTLTTVVEWLPKVGMDSPAPPTIRESLPAAVPHINNFLSKLEHFGDGAFDMSSKVAHAASAVYAGATNSYKTVKGLTRMFETGLSLVPML